MQDFSCSHCIQDSSACLYLTRCLFHFDRGVAKAWSQAYFGEGSGPVLLDEVRCTGNELSIEQCPKSSWQEHNCGHKEDAGVSCTPLAGSSITNKRTRTTVTHAELLSLEREFLKSAIAQTRPSNNMLWQYQKELAVACGNFRGTENHYSTQSLGSSAAC